MEEIADRITVDPGVMVGKPVIKGTRITVEFILELFETGWTLDEVLEGYQHLTRDDVLACLAYARKLVVEQRRSRPAA